VEIVRDIAHALCKEDIGFSSLVSSTADKDLLHEVIRRSLCSYENLRRKDSVRKLNASRQGPNKWKKHFMLVLGAVRAIQKQNS
jgi:hypothetical protein